MENDLTIYIGFDEKESAAFFTLAHSIMRHASRPVKICPLNLKNLEGVYLREYDERQSNSFSFSRFLVPYLNSFSGTAIFMDCDMLVTSDIYKVLNEVDLSQRGVAVVKHDYKSKVLTKYLGNQQYNYPRKNWSSFIVWNCAYKRNRLLTPEYIRDADAATLHRFLWLDDNEIAELDSKWNFLVGEYELTEITPAIIHWTLGGPYFDEYGDTDYHELWSAEYDRMTHTEQIVND